NNIIVIASSTINKSSLYKGRTQKRKNKDGTYESNLGILFLINKSSKVEAVDFAILLKNDKIIFLPMKLIIITTVTIEIKISPEANSSDILTGSP
ncbi:MAG: hypothetical protein ISQ42_00335, partial [Flavobacteriaceae bacterium]|nr:hypothetical protein [Flavobacteriaceae bacterium]